MSSAGETEISTDEVVRVELCDNGEGQHSYDGGTNGWSDDIGQSIANDDDEDNWSRQVETDEIIHRVPSSVTGGDTITIGDDDDGQGALTVAAENSDSHEQHHQPVLIPQPRPLPTMKEKLVERERQRRVESERARWKRQFAMAAHAEAENDEDDNNHRASGDANQNQNNIASGSITDHDHSFLNDRHSVAGTVGEDTVAPIDTLEEHNNDANMNYPMERFLQDQHGSEIEDQNNNTKKETQGVVMERFLQEQPTAVPGNGGSLPPSTVDSLHGSVPNESSIGRIIDDDLPLLDLPPNDSTRDMIENELSGEPIDDNEFQSPSQQPRVILRLTEAEIQEMAAIDDASRSNAPPSERDDISELGELVSDFGLTHIDNQNMSQGTPVTAIESVTSSVGQIGQITVLSGSSSDHGGIDGLEAHSISSNVVASSAGGDVSLTGNPPSEVADDDTSRGILSPRLSQVPTEILPTTTTLEVPTSPYATGPIAGTPMSNDSGADLNLPTTDEIIVNRTMRPGLFNYKEHQQGNSRGNTQNPYPSEEIEKSADRQILTDVDHHIEGFDFDKDNYASPPQGDIVGTRNDMWSPGFSESNNTPDYGAMTATEDVVENLQLKRFSAEPEGDGEKKPLLGGVPPAVNVTIKSHRRESPRMSLWSIRNANDLNSLIESVFNDLQYESSLSRSSVSNEQGNMDTAMLNGMISGRTLTLMVTLVLEMPTFFLIAGGSDRLCNLIGQTKFTTLVALLPIVSAMSGNVAVQASTLTSRAIRDGHVKVENYTSWLAKEMKTAGDVGMGMGVVTGTIAFMMGGFSIPFALSMFTSQFIGIFVGGCVGSLAPVCIGLFSQQGSSKWGSLLETAVQDVVASFLMIVISYQIMLLFGPYETGSQGVCSASA